MKKLCEELQISPTDRLELQNRSRSTTLPHRKVQRAKIILHLASQKSIRSVQNSLSVSNKTIYKWLKRFLKSGISGLEDIPRPGKEKKYTPYDEARVIEKACTAPNKGYTNWSQNRIAKEVGMSQSTVCRILKKNDLKPHKTEYWCGKSKDPEFEKKMQDVVGLYLNPPERAIVLSIDEKTQMQALDRTQPLLPLRSGLPKRLTATYKRNGTVSLIAALEVHKGKVTARTIDKNNSENFLKFLKYIYRKYTNTHLHIIVDNLNVHKHHKVKEWIQRRRKLTVHFTPTYSSWLNQIEIWFGILQKDVIKNGVWESKKQMEDRLLEYIKNYNKERAKPFKWTYDGSKKSK